MDVLIVEPIATEVERWLSARHVVRLAPELALDPAACVLALSKARAAILPPSVALDAETLWNAPHLRVVGRLSAGVENIDHEACARAGVEVARAGGASAAAEAEFVIGALLAMLRRVPILNEEGLLVGRELGACMVGLVGATPTTVQLAHLLAAFGARVVGYDPGVHAADPSWAKAGVRPVGLLQLMHESDAVCVLLNHYPRFNGLFGRRILGAAKPDQVIVSLAFSQMFDEQALAEGLRSGRLAAAWLDSLEPGALDAGRPLSQLDTLQVTPRVGGTTQESRLRSAWAVALRIDDVLRVAPPRSALSAAPPGASAGPVDVPASA